MDLQYVYCMQSKHERKRTISLRVPPGVLGEIDDLVPRMGLKSRTEFIERAVAAYVQELKEAKVIVVRPWTPAKARAAILRYLGKKPSAYVSEIAEVLGMDFEMAFRVVGALMEVGDVGRAR